MNALRCLLRQFDACPDIVRAEGNWPAALLVAVPLSPSLPQDATPIGEISSFDSAHTRLVSVDNFATDATIVR